MNEMASLRTDLRTERAENSVLREKLCEVCMHLDQVATAKDLGDQERTMTEQVTPVSPQALLTCRPVRHQARIMTEQALQKLLCMSQHKANHSSAECAPRVQIVRPSVSLLCLRFDATPAEGPYGQSVSKG